ncbi:NAD-dependent deacylase [Roseomonas sp. OT10]|uniref:NAD-dependent deacylase n=1 Tax=Roseomonas cutis TaxID=2897332 RepID=UPI001E4A3A97|nr:NAD-dependent deacylase [Roseomonas sp. OT10]UFN50381.1 NAD-dependent deacylase [Roseomonas sp. OT10]
MSSSPAILLLTGAGISQESGLHTFRDRGGIWATVPLEEVATPEAFARDPGKVQGFYNARRAQLREVQPNAAHLALAELDARWPGELLLVTQNVDDLHDRAGTKRLVHMHGELRKARCLRCGAVSSWEEDLSTVTPCPACGQAGGMRPDIVWFGEMPMHMEAIEAALARCDIFVSIGTSGNVYPAAGFVAQARRHARTLELNLEPSAGAAGFHETRHGPATVLVPAFVREMLGRLP